MPDIHTRPMTAPEFATLRSRLIREYAAEHVAAGNWTAGEAEARASHDTDVLLPQGVDTPGALLLVAETPGHDVVGHLWIALERHVGRGGGAWIYDIEVVPEYRGHGYGRALLTAAEEVVASRGVDVLGLNVFGTNEVARNLYESSGFETTAMQMRKRLATEPGAATL